MSQSSDAGPPNPDQVSKQWSIRAYRPQDQTAVMSLFTSSFKRPISAAYWTWKNQGSAEVAPLSAPNVWVVPHKDKPIFHYAGIPIRFQTPAGSRTIVVAVDAVTDPAFRRQGILTQASRAIYDQWRAAGVPFLLGMPNDQWGSRRKVLDWYALFPLQWLVLPLFPERHLARRLNLRLFNRFTLLSRVWKRWWRFRHRPPAGLTIHPITQAGREIDELWARCANDAQLGAVRDSQWVNWRYLSAPENPYQVVSVSRAGQTAGYCAFRQVADGRRQVGFVAELFASRKDEEARQALARHVIDQLWTAGAETAVTLAIPNTPVYRSWRKAGLIRGRHHFTMRLVPLSDEFPVEWLRNPDNWNLAGGVFDLI